MASFNVLLGVATLINIAAASIAVCLQMRAASQVARLPVLPIGLPEMRTAGLTPPFRTGSAAPSHAPLAKARIPVRRGRPRPGTPLRPTCDVQRSASPVARTGPLAAFCNEELTEQDGRPRPSRFERSEPPCLLHGGDREIIVLAANKPGRRNSLSRQAAEDKSQPVRRGQLPLLGFHIVQLHARDAAGQWYISIQIPEPRGEGGFLVAAGVGINRGRADTCMAHPLLHHVERHRCLQCAYSEAVP